MYKIESDVTGIMVKILVAPGDMVSAGDEVALIESMKMELPVITQSDGKVEAINFRVGDAVQQGDIILLIKLSC